MSKKLPIGVQTFRKLREEGFLYVDKTRHIYQLITGGEVYFLSRPRRFGKSLTISTLEEIFLGNKELFEGLWIYQSDYDWKRHPVVRLDMGERRVFSAEELGKVLADKVGKVGTRLGVSLTSEHYSDRLAELLEKLAEEEKAVILIDEYDKPILDNIENVEEAKQIREVLKGFYTTIKACDRYLRFVFLTGVSKFSKTGVFSGLNNLKDITMDHRFCDFLGYTEEELDQYFREHIKELADALGTSYDECRQEMRDWYNGFRFSEEEVYVYNPYTTLLLLDTKRFRNYWFESGTPTFLLKLIEQKRFDVRKLEDLRASELAFSSYEVEDLNVVPILFQTGYLTIKDYDPKTRLYTLGYPNREVEESFTEVLLQRMGRLEPETGASLVVQMVEALEREDLEGFMELVDTMFAQIPYELFLPREKYFQTVFYLAFKLMGYYAHAEVMTSKGRVDAAVELEDKVYVFEFKFERGAKEALGQIEERGYHERYLGQNKKIYLVGVDFSLDQKGVKSYESKTLG